MIRKKLLPAVVCLLLLSAVAGPAQGADKPDALARNGMVATAHPLASQIGVAVLKNGGNAFDAAIAIAFAVHVAEPNASGIGGGGFAILYSAKDRKSYIIDFREKAPAMAYDGFYKLDDKGKPVDDSMKLGWYASGVPGQLAGMEMLHQRFAGKKWSELLAPAIALLEDGVPVNKTLHGIVADQMGRIQRSPTRDFFEKTFMKDGLPLEEGQKYYNPDLVASLKLVAEQGAKAFYTGPIAEKIAAAYAANGNGWITKADLAAYKAVLRAPVEGTYRKHYKLLAFPPPSSGGLTVIEILNILEKFNLKKMGYAHPDAVHAMIEAQKLAFADRNKYMADPDFVFVPARALLSKRFAASRAGHISMNSAIKGAEPGAILRDRKGSTTSFSVIDKAGNMITVTQTINSFMGSVTVPEGTGILMNNEMDDFTPRQGQANSVQAGKRPLSSMASVLVFKNNKPYLTMGSPGGPRIITAMANILVNVADYGMDLQEAIEAPRFHNPNTEKTAMEGRWSPELREALTARGQSLDMRKDVDLYFGGAQGVMIRGDGMLHGGADIRRGGKALGY